MSDDHLMLSRDVCRAVTDAFQRAIVDRGAATATRRAAFLALLRLVDAGVVVDSAAPPEPPPTAPDDGHDAARAAVIPVRPPRGRSRKGSESPLGRPS